MLRRPQLGGCQNYGPFLGTLNIRCRIIIGIHKRTIILTTTQHSTADWLKTCSPSTYRKQPYIHLLEEILHLNSANISRAQWDLTLIRCRFVLRVLPQVVQEFLQHISAMDPAVKEATAKAKEAAKEATKKAGKAAAWPSEGRNS